MPPLYFGFVVGAFGTARPAPTGDLAQATLLTALDPVNGVRLVELKGSAEGEAVTIWAMIADRHYLKLIECGKRRDGRGAVISYSDASHMVNAVVCG
ncbi:MAG: hypothetical protein R2909_14510 [Gemmatimonadales bacterium]